MSSLKTSFNKSADKMHYYWRAMEPFYFLVIVYEITEIQNGFGINVIKSSLEFILFLIGMYLFYKYERSRPIIEFTPQELIIKGKKYPYSDIDCIYTKPGDKEDESAFWTISSYFFRHPKIIPEPWRLFKKWCPNARIISSKMLYIQLKENAPFKFRKRKGYYFDLDNDFSEEDTNSLLENFKKHNIRYEKCDTREICITDMFLDFVWNIGKYFLISIFILECIRKFLSLFFE